MFSCEAITNPIENALIRLWDQARASIPIHRKFISLKIVVQISVAVKGVYPKDREPMLVRHRHNIIFILKVGRGTLKQRLLHLISFRTLNQLST